MIRSSSSFFGGVFLLGFFGGESANPLQKVQFALAVLFGASETWTCDFKINFTPRFFADVLFARKKFHASVFFVFPSPLKTTWKIAPSVPPNKKNTSAQPTNSMGEKVSPEKTLQPLTSKCPWLIPTCWEILGLVTWKALPLRILEGLQGLAFGVVSSITGTSALEALGELRFNMCVKHSNKNPPKRQ